MYLTFFYFLVQIEMVRHFGKEHYCPLSLLRVFGRSEVEELEDSEDHHVDHENSHDAVETTQLSELKDKSEDTLPGESNNDPTNFLKSATNAVIGLVNKATKTFTGTAEQQNKTNMTGDEKAVHDRNETEQLSFTNAAKNNNSDIGNNTVGKKNVNSTSDLVVLMEGDYGEEEHDLNQTVKKCIFSGEIEGDKCANPSDQFWIPLIFKYQMCPFVGFHDRFISREIEIDYSTEYSASIDRKNTGKPSDLSETRRRNGSLDASVIRATSFSSAAKSTESTSNLIEGSSSAQDSTTNHEKYSESKSFVDEVSFSSKKDSLFTASQHVPKTELATQLHTESTSSCATQTFQSVDLSQLLSIVVSTKDSNKQPSIENSKKNTVASVNKSLIENSNETDKIQQNENGQRKDLSLQQSDNGHVDVLVINIDEKLGEGKAEISEKLPTNASETKEDTLNMSKTAKIIEPSFSQPISASLSSQRTSETLRVAPISSNTNTNQSISGNVKVSVIPASVQESPGYSQSIVIKATSISTPQIQLIKSSSVGADLNDVNSSSEKEKSETEKQEIKESCAFESTVKIGSGSSGNNKESAILKLKSKVKALETNLSLSTLYLEEMSKRYRTALEEQQKLFKSKVNLLNLTIIDHKDTIQEQQQAIKELAKQLAQLSSQFRNFTDISRKQQAKVSFLFYVLINTNMKGKNLNLIFVTHRNMLSVSVPHRKRIILRSTDS